MHSPVTAFQFGILTTIEMVTAMLIYIPVAYFADRSHKKPFVVTTFVFFTLFPLALLFCQSFALLASAFVLRGLKEFGGAFLWQHSPATNSIAAFAFGAAGTLWFALWGREPGAVPSAADPGP